MYVKDDWYELSCVMDFLSSLSVKYLPAMQETPVWFLDREDPLEKG